MAEVVFDQASRIYTPGAKPAVDRLDLAVTDGELVVLVGPSGSGKSTALRMLAGLEPIDAGSVRIDGRDVVDVPSKDRDIAMVFQNYALYPHMTVADNMGFALKIAGVKKEEIRSRVDEAAKILDLEQYGGLRGSSDRLALLDDWGLETTRRLLSEVPPPTPFA